MYKISILCASLALSLTPTSVQAGPDQGIHVTARPVTVVQWAQHTGKLLDRSLARNPNWPTQAEGIVAVKFLCSETGAPSNIAVLQSSGSKRLDEAAMKAVGRIATLHPLPDGVTHEQKFVATVLFANDSQSYWRQLDSLRQTARLQTDKFNHPTNLALGVGLLNAAESSVQVN